MTDDEDTAAVQDYLAGISHPIRKRDATTLVELMTRATGQPPRMWGTSIVGFGQHHYVYASGREGDTAAVGFAARKAAITVYLTDGIDAHKDALADLGPHTTGVGCLYLRDCSTIDLDVLESIVTSAYAGLAPETEGQPAPDGAAGPRGESRQPGS